eukprot:gene24551-29447_t
MSIDNSAAPVKKLDPLNTLMGVRAVSVEPGDLAFAQAVGERFHDHRGKTVLGSIGVMIDGAMGGAVYSGLTSGHQSVLAQVTVSAGADIPDVADVGATGTLVHLDDGVGLASGQLRDENGTLLAVMAGRAMVVSRPPVVGIDDYVEGEPLPVPTPEKTSDLSGLSGSDVVEGIRDGKLERGPLAGLLDLAVVDVTPGSVVGEFAPVAWMANPLGAVQGGVLISAVDAITGLSAQTLTSVDQDYRVLDHKIDFLRSPDIGGPVMRAEASVIRAGRRLALIETRIVDAGGQVYVRATSSIQMLSQQVARPPLRQQPTQWRYSGVNKDIEASRLRVSRRRALALGGTITPQCVMSKEETQGPYWFDVDSIRGDIREDRPGTTLQVAMRVQDNSQCNVDGSIGAVSNAVVEIWHCDAGGVYSGFESGSLSANGGGGAPGGMGGGMGGSGETSDGSYSVGDTEATTTDDGTYLRGAQTTDANGIAQFTTIFPGWYMGRTTHIHVKVHIDKKTVLTSQTFFDETLLDEVYSQSPYSEHTGLTASTTTPAS